MQILGKDRNEGDAHRPLADEAAQHVGQSKGDEKGVRRDAGAEIVSSDRIAQQPGNAAGQRHCRDYDGCASDATVLAHREGSKGPKVQGAKLAGLGWGRRAQAGTLGPLDPWTLGELTPQGPHVRRRRSQSGGTPWPIVTSPRSSATARTRSGTTATASCGRASRATSAKSGKRSIARTRRLRKRSCAARSKT